MESKTNTAISPTIKATYVSLTTTETFEKPLILFTKTTEDSNRKATYLNSLRLSTKQLQNDLNGFLTAKMEEDKAAATKSTSSNPHSQASKPQDEEEEENYGEEKVEED